MSKFGNIFKNYRFTLNSRILLYFILILTIGDLMYFSLAGEMLFFFIFIITGYLTSFFSKNMVVILVVSMTVTHVLRFGKTSGTEGMDSQDSGEHEEEDNEHKVKTVQETWGEDTGVQNIGGDNGHSAPDINITHEPFDPDMDKTTLNESPASSVPMRAGPASSLSTKGSTVPIASAINKLKQSTAQIQQIKDNLQASREKQIASPVASPSFAPSPASSSLNKTSDLSNLMSSKIDSPLAINNSKPIVSGFENLDEQTKKLLNTQQELMINMDNLSPLLAQSEKFMAKFQGLAK